MKIKTDIGFEIRKKAEELHQIKNSNGKYRLSKVDNLKLIYELEIHQIELELQNEKLLLLKKESENAIEICRELYDYAPAGYLMLSNKSKIIEINISGCKLLENKKSKLIGKQFGFFVSNDTKIVFDDFLAKVFRDEIKECCELKLVMEDNTILNVYLTGIVMKNKHQALITVIDFTNQKKTEFALIQSEKRHRDLLDNLDVGIIVHSHDTSIIYSNPKASELIGLSYEQIKGKDSLDPIWDFLIADTTLGSEENFPVKQIISTKKALSNFIIKIKKTKKTAARWLLLNGFPVFNLNGDIIEIIVSFIEITELKKIEIEFKKAKNVAELASKSKSSFLTNMSHEIRTPLNGIIGFTDLLMKTNLDENQKEYMNTVNESAIILIEIINDILDFSKIESGKLELNYEKTNLYELAQNVINIFKYQASINKIDLILNIESSVPNFVVVDSLRLKQILVNLIGNALKFTKTGFVHLDITNAFVVTEDNKCNLIFSVKDSGIGIKEENQVKVFQSFMQEDCSITGKFGGTGLGLPISNQLLGLMGSKLQLKSKYSFGSEFYFNLVLEKASQENLSPEVKLEIVLDDNTFSDFSDKTILVVEDNKINMLLVKILLKKIVPGSVILEASNGDEAIEMCEKENLDLILMDIQMPNKNGYQTTSEIKQLEKCNSTPIIALTAGIMQGEKEKCLNFGMNDYVSKPIIKCNLEAVLYKWLKK